MLQTHTYMSSILISNCICEFRFHHHVWDTLHTLSTKFVCGSQIVGSVPLAPSPSQRTKGAHQPTISKEDQFTDTILVLEGKKLYINRCILGYASPYFQRLLDSAHKAAIAEKKSKAEVKISNKSYTDFVDLLTYLHPGTGSDVTGIYSTPNRIKGSLGKFTSLNNLIIWYVDIGHIFFST